MLKGGARLLAAVLAVAVLVVTGYAWSAYRQLDTGLVTSDVLNRQRSPDGATDVLIVGLDSRTDAQGNPLPQSELNALHAGPDTGELNTDTIILLRIPDDPARPASAVSIPRDSYVEIPGFGKHKINSAYQRGMLTEMDQLAAQGVTGPAAVQQADQAGRRLLVRTVEQLTGLSIDHYAEVNLVGFAAITEAVGGVPVCLKAPVDDPYSGADFPAGPQTLEGPPALAFVRQRHGLPRGDLDRIVRQQAFLASLAHTVLSAGTLADPGKLSRLISTVQRYVVTDPGFDLLALATRPSGLTSGDVRFSTIPTGDPALQTPEDGVAVQVDPAQVQAYVAALVGTAPPRAAAATSGPGPVPDPPPATTAAAAPTSTPPAPPISSVGGVPCVN